MYFWNAFFVLYAKRPIVAYQYLEMKMLMIATNICAAHAHTDRIVDNWQCLFWSNCMFSIVICFILHVCETDKKQAKSENTGNYILNEYDVCTSCEKVEKTN